MKAVKTANGWQVITSSTKSPVSADNLSEAEAKTLVRKIEAYKASRRGQKVNKSQSPNNGKRA